MEQKWNSIRLTLLGGINEVGGNTVLLEDNDYDVKIFIVSKSIKTYIK